MQVFAASAFVGSTAIGIIPRGASIVPAVPALAPDAAPAGAAPPPGPVMLPLHAGAASRAAASIHMPCFMRASCGAEVRFRITALTRRGFFLWGGLAPLST